MDIRDDRLRSVALEGSFGLERESLRVTPEGRFAKTPHPFPPEDPRVVRDFCENQTEINTRVHPTAQAAVAELAEQNARILRLISQSLISQDSQNLEKNQQNGRSADSVDSLQDSVNPVKSVEYLWPFSNPPPIVEEGDIAPARFEGILSSKTAYRDYLSAKYGRHLMAFCGIHVNFSFGENLIRAAGVDKSELYLHVAEETLRHGWLAVVLCAASPVMDASFYEISQDLQNLEKNQQNASLSVNSGSDSVNPVKSGKSGRDLFCGFASVRCGELGYWNHFTPVLDFGSVRGYAASIERYVREGLLAAPSELYYPVRLKPRGPNRLDTLVANGVDHIELRCVDLNPLTGGLVDARDVEFIRLFFLWCAARPRREMSAQDQVAAIRNFKTAARFDIDLAEIYLPEGVIQQDLQNLEKNQQNGSLSVNSGMDSVNPVKSVRRSVPVRRAALALLADIRAFFADFPEDVRAVIDFQIAKLSQPGKRYADIVRERFSGTFAEKGLAWAKAVAREATRRSGFQPLETNQKRQDAASPCSLQPLEAGRKEVANV